MSLTINNPFKQFNDYSTYTQTPDFEQNIVNQNYYRNFRLGFNYKFGKLNPSIKTNHQGINNDDVKKDNGGEN